MVFLYIGTELRINSVPTLCHSKEKERGAVELQSISQKKSLIMTTRTARLSSTIGVLHISHLHSPSEIITEGNDASQLRSNTRYKFPTTKTKVLVYHQRVKQEQCKISFRLWLMFMFQT